MLKAFTLTLSFFILTGCGKTPQELSDIINGNENYVEVVGVLDPTFASSGIYTNSDTYPTSLVALQSDGKLVVVGSDGTDWKLRRLNSDGSLDASFGTAGITSFSGTEAPKDLFIDSSDNIYINSRIEIGKFSSNGLLDAGFATAGKYTLAHNGYMLNMDSSGNLYCAGHSGTTTKITKITSSGSPVSVFSPLDGTVVQIYSFTIDSSDSIYLGGIVSDGGFKGFVAKVKANGTIDGTYGTGSQGWLSFNVAGGYPDVKSLSILADGSLIVSGVLDASKDMFITKIDNSGVLDVAFGASGFVTPGYTASTTNGDFQGYQVEVLSSGNILAIGNNSNEGVLTKYDSNGSLVTGFASSGVLSINPDAGSDTVESIAIGLNGAVYATGYSDGDFYVAKVR